MSSDLEKKVAELEVIVKNASNKQDKDLLVSVMRTLADLLPELERAKEEQALLKDYHEQSLAEIKELKETLEEKNYQILHLKKNLKSFMDKVEIQ